MGYIACDEVGIRFLPHFIGKASSFGPDHSGNHTYPGRGRGFIGCVGTAQVAAQADHQDIDHRLFRSRDHRGHHGHLGVRELTGT